MGETLSDHQPELKFGEVPGVERGIRKKRANKNADPKPEGVYDAYRLKGLFEYLVSRDYTDKEKFFEESRSRREITDREYFGVTAPRVYTFSPSTSSQCVRWEGYQAYKYERKPVLLKSMIAAKDGQALHREYTAMFRNYTRSEVEWRLVYEAPPMTGRTDVLLLNPRLKQHQVLDLKFVGDYTFGKLSRDRLDSELDDTKGIYTPSEEYKDQVAYYMLAAASQGKNVISGNILYKDRDEVKEALMIWNARTQARAQEFVHGKIKPASELINRNLNLDIPREEKPLPEPTVRSPYVCSSFCPFYAYCLPGQKIVKEAGLAKKAIRGPVSKEVANAVKRQKKEDQKHLQDLGISIPRLFDL